MISPHLFGKKGDEVDHVIGLAGEALAELGILGGDTDGAGVEVALPHHDAAGRNQRRGRKAELVGTEKGTDDDVAAGPQAPVHLHGDAAAEVVEHERLMGLGEPDLPRQARVLDRGDRAGPGSALEPGDGDVVGVRLRDAGGDGADTHFGDQLDADPRVGIDVLQIEDELRQVLDRIDVVVRRRRDQADTRRRMTDLGDPFVDLVAGKLATLARLGALRDLDLQIVGVDQILGGDAEPAGRHLLDRRTHRIAVRQRLEAGRFLAALAGVGLAAEAVHGDRQRRVRLERDRAERHGPCGEPLDDLADRLDLVERYRLAPPA